MSSLAPQTYLIRETLRLESALSRKVLKGNEMKKLMKGIGIVSGGLIGLMLLAGLGLYFVGMDKLNRSYPGVAAEMVSVPTDSNAVVRGKHIAIIWACTECHGADLSGKLIANNPFVGTIPASNLTSGSGGIAKTYTDADWIRAIRYGVKPDSRVVISMYDYSTLSDQDLGDLMAYLRQIPPVDSNQPVYPTG
jgi:cytochrome c553